MLTTERNLHLLSIYGVTISSCAYIPGVLEPFSMFFNDQSWYKNMRGARGPPLSFPAAN